MKRTFTLLLCILLIISCGCSKKSKEYTPEKAEDVIVYVTKTGSKYHTKKCYHLKKSCFELSLYEAVYSGYAPCSNCIPPEIKY